MSTFGATRNVALLFMRNGISQCEMRAALRWVENDPDFVVTGRELTIHLEANELVIAEPLRSRRRSIRARACVIVSAD